MLQIRFVLVPTLSMTAVSCGPEVAEDLYRTCSTESDCAANERCSKSQFCEPLTGVSGQCTQDNECILGLQCVTSSEWNGSLCTAECTTECLGTAVCSNGFCFEPCSTDSDCLIGVACTESGLCGRVFDEP